MESNTRGVYFSAEFRVKWTPRVLRKTQRNQADSVKQHIFLAASRTAKQSSIAQLAYTQFNINAELGKIRKTEDRCARIKSVQVCLSASTEAAEYLEKTQKEERAATLQESRLARLEEFRNLVFHDTSTAISYWLMNHPEHLHIEDYNHLQSLVGGIAQNDPQSQWRQVSQVVSSFVSGLDEGDKRDMLELLKSLMSRFGHRDEADQIAMILDPVRYRTNNRTVEH